MQPIRWLGGPGDGQACQPIRGACPPSLPRDWRGRGAQCPSRPGVAVPVNLSHKVKGIYSRPLPPSPSESGRGGACEGTDRAAGPASGPAPPALSPPRLGLEAASGSPEPPALSAPNFPHPHTAHGERGPGRVWEGAAGRVRAGVGRESGRGAEVTAGTARRLLRARSARACPDIRERCQPPPKIEFLQGGNPSARRRVTHSRCLIND